MLIDGYVLREPDSTFPPRRGVVESVGEMAKTPTCRPHVAYTANLSPNERLHVAYMSTTRLFFE